MVDEELDDGTTNGADAHREGLTPETRPGIAGPIRGLLPALERLDRLLHRAVELTEVTLGTEAREDRFRGLYITREDVERSLGGSPAEGGLFDTAADGPLQPFDIDDDTRIVWLARTLALSPFDVNVLLLALAPEIDLKYERIYAFLQDNVTRTRPTVELALNLLSRSVEEKLGRIERFQAAAPLLREGILELLPDSGAARPPLLAHYLALDPQITGFLLGLGGPDRRLADFVESTHPMTFLEEQALDPEVIEGVASLLDRAIEAEEPVRIYLRGRRGVGTRDLAEAIAAEAGKRMLVVRLGRMLAAESDASRQVRRVFRQAWLDDAVLLWLEADALFDSRYAEILDVLLSELRDHPGICVLTGEAPWVPSPSVPTGVVAIDLEPPGFHDRSSSWVSCTARYGIDATDDEITMLADRFRLTGPQIEDAVSVARQRLSWDVEDAQLSLEQTGEPGRDTRRLVLEHLLAAARSQTGHALARLTQRIEPVYRKADIVLPAETLRQLDEICTRVARRHTVLDDWGWEDKLSLGKGTSALFSGPSGTGKTMAAEVIANEVGLELYRIDLATVMDKYVGETEKKLDQIFEAAGASNAVLLFDEADALFGKRSEVRDSHDRYANVEISYLLQKIEEYDQLALLATNLPQNLDEAFTRRLTFTVRFPAPDIDGRRQIWEKIWPARTPLSDDLDLDYLAREYRLTGGNIKNIAMAACFYAAEEGTSVTMDHVLRATRREFEQLGKPMVVPAQGRREPLGA